MQSEVEDKWNACDDYPVATRHDSYPKKKARASNIHGISAITISPGCDEFGGCLVVGARYLHHLSLFRCKTIIFHFPGHLAPFKSRISVYNGFYSGYMELREMVPECLNDTEYPIPRKADRGGLFRRIEAPDVSFPIQSVRIDWDRLIAKRPLILETVEQMPVYLLKPEILGLLNAEKDPTYQLILDLMWTTGARISEVLALRTTSFVDDGYGFGVILKTLKQRPGRPSKALCTDC